MTTAAADRIPGPIVLRYGLGQVGAQVFRDTPAVLLPLFLTTMLGIEAWIAGVVVLIPKLWLIVCDPLVGGWSDRLKATMGRTPFLIGGAFGTALGFVSLFTISAYPSPAIAAAVTCLLFFLASTAFSIYSVPYLAIAAELSRDTHERNRIMVWRMVFATLGVLLGVGAAQPLVQHFGGGPHGWRVMSWVLGAVCLITMLITAQSLRKTPLIPSDQPPGNLRAQIAQVRRNRPFMILLATSFISNVGQASSYTALGFVFLYVVKAIWLIPLFILAMSSAAILSQPLWLWLPRRIGKPRSYMLASGLWALVTVTWFWVSPLSDAVVQLPWGLPVLRDHVLVIVRAFAIGFVNGGFIMLALSMMTDTVDYQRRHIGVASEGVFAGLFSAFEKLAFAVGPLIAGVVLSLFGFISSTGVEVPQSASAINGIVLLYSVIPAAMQCIALVIFSRYALPEA